MDQPAFVAQLRAALAADEETARRHCEWPACPHNIGPTSRELVEAWADRRYWRNQAGRFADVGRGILRGFVNRTSAADPIVFTFAAGQRGARWKLELEPGPDGGRARQLAGMLFTQLLRNTDAVQFCGYLQRPPPSTPCHLFFDLDEIVEDGWQLERNAAWVEHAFGPLLEFAFPGRRWVWLRATHPRQDITYEYEGNRRVEVLASDRIKAGIHVFVDVWVTHAQAKTVTDWVMSMLLDHDHYQATAERRLVGQPAGIDLDPCDNIRTLGTFKGIPCNPQLRPNATRRAHQSCASNCVDCNGTGVYLVAPPYLPTPDHWNLETFLLCSTFPAPPGTSPTPFSSPFQAYVDDATVPTRFGRSAFIPSSNDWVNADLVMDARMVSAVSAYVRRSTTLKLFWKDGAPPGLRILRAREGPAILVHFSTTNVCYFKSDQERSQRESASQQPEKRRRLMPKAHNNNHNYLLLSCRRRGTDVGDASVELRCISKKYAHCRHDDGHGGKMVLEPLSEREGKDIFGPTYVSKRGGFIFSQPSDRGSESQLSSLSASFSGGSEGFFS